MVFKSLFDELRNETDRACAVLARGILETHLQILLEKFLIKSLSKKDAKELFNGNGSLATFSSRTKISYALGLIRKIEKDALNALRDISNEFAHLIEGKLTFDDARFKGKIESTELFQLFWKSNDPEIEKIKLKHNTTRKHFEFVLGVLVGSLYEKQRKTSNRPEAEMTFPPIF